MKLYNYILGGGKRFDVVIGFNVQLAYQPPKGSGKKTRLGKRKIRASTKLQDSQIHHSSKQEPKQSKLGGIDNNFARDTVE